MLSRKIFVVWNVLFISVFTYSQEENKHVLLIHGGAGNFDSSLFSEDEYKSYYDILNHVLMYGDSLLREGHAAIDVVTECVIILEDCPLFNAGKGAVVNSDGIHELDASIMDGRTLDAGAVCGIRNIKNPIRIARLVMDNSPHVMLSTEGAQKFAIENGFELVEAEYFYVDKVMDNYQRLKKSDKGTVGAVALDKNGNIAAGTSTGGMMMKKYGRVGDSPIIGAGTYADNNFAAVSCTGHGEFFIRLCAAYSVIAKMKYGDMSLNQAAELTIKEIGKLGGDGGIIAIDKNGNIVMPFNTKSMFRAWINSEHKMQILF